MLTRPPIEWTFAFSCDIFLTTSPGGIVRLKIAPVLHDEWNSTRILFGLDLEEFDPLPTSLQSQVSIQPDQKTHFAKGLAFPALHES